MFQECEDLLLGLSILKRLKDPKVQVIQDEGGASREALRLPAADLPRRVFIEKEGAGIFVFYIVRLAAGAAAKNQFHQDPPLVRAEARAAASAMTSSETVTKKPARSPVMP